MIATGYAMVAVLAIAIRLRPVGLRQGVTSGGPIASRGRPSRRAATDWAEFIDSVAGEVRAGHSLRRALDAALHQHRPDGQVLALGATLDHLEAVTTDPDEAVAMHSITTAMRLGGPVAAGLHAAAALLRERHATRADALAHSAQARLSARVLTAVPMVFCVWSAAASGSFRATLTTGPGATVAAAGIACNLAGWRWMRHVIAQAAR